MSELKAVYAYTLDKIEVICSRAEGDEYYIKSEVDLEIAKLKAQKAQAEDDCAYWKTMAQKNAADNSVMAKQRAEVFKQLTELKEGAKNLILDNYLKDKEIRHHKYKRCLALAKWCRLHDEFTQLESERLGLPQRAIFMEYRSKAMWWNKWHKRWLKIAEKFKEMK